MTTMYIQQFEVSRSFIQRSLYFRRRYIRQILAFGLAFLFLDLVFTLHRSQPASKPINPTHTNKEQIYIASLHWNRASLIREHWAPAVLDLVRYFGKDNIYVSIVEGGSWDDAKGALTELDLELEKLGVERTIELRNETHTDVVNRPPEQTGWIDSPRGRKDLRRIPYLASLRNRAMEKLGELAARKDRKRRFDKVLWLNDVIFDVCPLNPAFSYCADVE
jgi:Cryptococcal mannosyltransferase 1